MSRLRPERSALDRSAILTQPDKTRLNCVFKGNHRTPVEVSNVLRSSDKAAYAQKHVFFILLQQEFAHQCYFL